MISVASAREYTLIPPPLFGYLPRYIPSVVVHIQKHSDRDYKTIVLHKSYYINQNTFHIIHSKPPVNVYNAKIESGLTKKVALILFSR